MRWRARASSGARLSPSKRALPCSGRSRPRSVARIVSGCSRISLSMKWACPPSSSCATSQATSSTARSCTCDSRSSTAYPAGVSTAMSPSSRYTTERVCSSTADASDATNSSSSPIPSSTGDPCRATTTLPGSAADTTASPYVPSTRANAAITRASRVSPAASSIRCARVSVSVSVVKRCPARSSTVRSASAFSMIPLWTTATAPLQSVWGCALRVVGAPCVAQRVCAIPLVPCRGAPSSRVRSAPTRPASLATTTPAPFCTATPAESYPRYSSRCNPSTRIGAASRRPTYPMMPHMRQRSFGLEEEGGRRSSPSPPARPNRFSCASLMTRRAVRSSGPSAAPHRAHNTPTTAHTPSGPRSGGSVSAWLALHRRHCIAQPCTIKIGAVAARPSGSGRSEANAAGALQLVDRSPRRAVPARPVSGPTGLGSRTWRPPSRARVMHEPLACRSPRPPLVCRSSWSRTHRSG